MSVWSHITGIVHLDGSITEDELLGVYRSISHLLVGSEGGLTISFTRTNKKTWESTAECEYEVEPFTRLSNMVFNGSLRDFPESKFKSALKGIKILLCELKELHVLDSATFVLECDEMDDCYHVTFLRGEVKTKKI